LFGITANIFLEAPNVVGIFKLNPPKKLRRFFIAWRKLLNNTDHGIEAAAIVVGKKTTLVGGATAAGSGAIHGTDIGTEMAMTSGLDITGFCAMVGAFVAMSVCLY